jgi:two-component system nitrate/nitrite response regulator NarL
VRVVIVEDHPVCRYALEALIGSADGVTHVASAADGLSALAVVAEVVPDVVVLDVDLPGQDGLAVAARISAQGIESRCLFLSAYGDGSLVYDAMALGAAGFLTKDCEPDDIVSAVVAVAAGGTVISPRLQHELAHEIRVRSFGRQVSLTTREQQILTLLGEGASTAKVAAALHLSEATVKAHLHHAFEQLGVSDRTAAVVQALRAGLIDLGIEDRRWASHSRR